MYVERERERKRERERERIKIIGRARICPLPIRSPSGEKRICPSHPHVLFAF
jgi:hypothetical protein